ncbi:MAG: HAMP domain-containing protein [Gemmatimonadetes bacterium]|nr:HAMP domain-containing protein [Gemmatimonadota bacterium]NNM04387.1 HAMP domain-containing protein [Gemmatimonadota bacterium]
MTESLTQAFEALLEAGDQAVQEAAALMTDSVSTDLQRDLSRIRRRWSVSALAIYDGEGRPLAWVGVHRGKMPGAIRRAEAPYAFAGGPLFRYLYFTTTLPGVGGTAVAAVLLQANLPAGLEGSGFASRLGRETGIPIQILPPQRVNPERRVLDLGWADDPLLSVEMSELAPEQLWTSRVRLWARIIGLVAMVAWGLLVVGSRGSPGHGTGVIVSLVGIVLLLPAEHLWPGVGLTSPAQFLLPGPLDVSLGQLLGVLVALGVLCGLFPVRRLGRVGPFLVAAALAVGFPLLEAFLRAGPSAALLSSGPSGFFPYQLALGLLLGLAAYVALGLSGGEGGRPANPSLLAAGGGVALALSFLFALQARSGPGIPSVSLAAFAFPGYLMAAGLGVRTRGRRTLTWVLAAILGTAAALPAAWGAQIQARMTEAEAHLSDLGAEPDPYLEFRLQEMAGAADSLDAFIASPVELLFEIWASTGEHGDPLPMWITLWSPGDLPQENLSMGVRGPRPQEVDDFLEEARSEGRPVLRHLGLEDGRYVLLVPLEGDRVLSACVPPKGSTSLSSALGPIFAAMGQPSVGPLNLVPVSDTQGMEWEPGVRWERGGEGWRGNTLLRFPDGGYLARQTVALPRPLIMVARGTLALVLDLLVFLAIWGLGMVMARGRDVRPRSTFSLLGSFRARVTLALFGFFFLSVAIFGTLAFQTLSGAAVRTATALAERLVEDGALGYLDVSGQMELLAQEVGADLLEYRNGELIEGSAEELVELGLYEGWVPEPIFRTLEDRAEVRATHEASLARWAYVMAYRRLPDGDILGTPVPVEAGATALRRQEVADLLGFAIVLGAALSLALAFLVGGTLTRPIETLQVASERVGAGNLQVRLPADRSDEFGSVFAAFNRMVLGIRRARRALLRTTRRTQAIVEEAATGVVALDSAGKVTLANPRAEALLKEEIQPGEPLPGREGEAKELVRWVDLYFRDGLREANTEFQISRRRIRVRARRVTGEDPFAGAVLSLEDVTDELRTERILAWGEMAQQVAHEVKNPLTPIKLSVQHLQRAWEDRRADFGDILGKNIGVILREIEHLAAIAKSFSRFGAPQAAGEVPLEAVDVRAVTKEVMNLYRRGEGALEFESILPEELSLVQGRESELREVLINLLENSRTAIPEAGRVVIDAEETSQGVEICVRDNGKGISSDLLPRIFEPHFSTRSTGTGLGLAIVRRLVESWGGSVTAESEEGVGTEIKILVLPWGEGPESRKEE